MSEAQCAKCKTTNLEGGWVAKLTSGGPGVVVTQARGLCASCAKDLSEEERVAFVAQVAGEQEKAVKEAGDLHLGKLKAIREHFTPCSQCGGKDITVRHGRKALQSRTQSAHAMRVGCKSCGAVFLDVQEPGNVDLPAMVLAQLQQSLPAAAP